MYNAKYSGIPVYNMQTITTTGPTRIANKYRVANYLK